MQSNKVSNHYNSKYFNWQSSLGEFGGWANTTKFDQYVSKENKVLDFGCGGGYLLRNLNCHKKVGVEVNPCAVKEAVKNGIEVFSSSDAVPNDYVDRVISNNALEHTLHPLEELRILYDKLKFGGKLIFVVPCESISNIYKPNDINNHLYSWSPMCMGNILIEAGYKLIESKPYIHKWPPKFRLIAKLGGRGLFEFTCRLYGRINRSWFQVRAVAEKSI